MRYNKGTFTIVPNVDRLVCMPANTQCVYLRICRHADSNGVCFPSRKKLALECGMNIKTLDKCLTVLEECKFIKKTQRKKDNSKENISNLYQIMLFEDDNEVAPKQVQPSTEIGATSSPKIGSVTISNTNYNHLTNSDTNVSQDISLIIKSFEQINQSCSKFYGNTTQRKACEQLIENYSLDRVISVIEKTLPKTNGMQYFPTITTPLQLLDKWAALESAVRKYQSGQNTLISKNKVAFT